MLCMVALFVTLEKAFSFFGNVYSNVSSLALISASFQVTSLSWHPEGKAILLSGKDNNCVCYLAEEDET